MWGQKQVRDLSFHQSYFNLMQSATFTCPQCTRKQFSIAKTINREPNYLVLIDDSMKPTDINGFKCLTLTNSFVNPLTDNTYEFISSINIPSLHHYNVILKNPYFSPQNQHKKYYFRDGLVNNGEITKIDEDNMDIRPYIAIYKKVNN